MLQKIEATANFHIENDLISLVDLLKKKELNVIFFEIDAPKIQILASLRLAKIQISTWGHPITSGSDEIDYFYQVNLWKQNILKNTTMKN